MFAHEISEVCTFDEKCRNKLCPYRHTKVDVEDPELPDNVHDIIEADIDENDCHLCKETFESEESLTVHMETVHMDYFMEMIAKQQTNLS